MRRTIKASLAAGVALLIMGSQALAETIKVWSRQTDESAVILKNLTDAFTAKTGIQVETYNTGMDFEQRLARAAAGRDLPDIVVNDDSALGQMLKMGIIQQIDPAKIEGSDQVVPAAWESAKGADGKFYAVPVSAQAFALFVRKDWREKLGLPQPKTWDDLRKLAEAFTKNDPDGNGKADTFGMTIPASTVRGYASWFMSNFIWEAGGDYLKQENGGFKPDLANKAGADALGFVRSLFCEGLVQPGAINATTGDALPTFRSGQTGIFLTGPYHIAQLDEQPGKNVIEVLPPPAGPGGVAALAEGTSAYIMAGTKHREAAEKFISFFISPQGQEIGMAEGSGHTPLVRLPINKNVDVNAIRKDPRWETFKEVFDKHSHYVPPVPNWTPIRMATAEGFNKILSNCNADIPAELKKIDETVAAELTKQKALAE
ncbi:ABC transporter substrate-binding protein [Rhizobium paknamense]|uniref:Multiple sugar transport system substrate-binding protein n=1 Tax=Rhizobium paknamense TaxID=1206817 RepID=A0ABU0IER8_9HYPH|nr:sugar ABC transporter substrate-binding protein [Rhizobium paknamense]MDQ0455709.1 multiple sugar transport system substrate-binding protein [Rhizobium paknamense]